MNEDIRSAIIRAAQEHGIDPSYALAVAERESKFNPNARASKSIYGLFQMSGALRNKYGSGDSSDPYEQARAFSAFTKDLQGDMASRIGRQPSPQETYLGHYWGGGRASRMLTSVHPETPTSELFTPNELSQNPGLVRAKTAGALISSTMGDIGRRQAKYGGQGQPAAGFDSATFGEPASFDSSQWGELDTVGSGDVYDDTQTTSSRIRSQGQFQNNYGAARMKTITPPQGDDGMVRSGPPTPRTGGQAFDSASYGEEAA